MIATKGLALNDVHRNQDWIEQVDQHVWNSDMRDLLGQGRKTVLLGTSVGSLALGGNEAQLVVLNEGILPLQRVYQLLAKGMKKSTSCTDIASIQSTVWDELGME